MYLPVKWNQTSSGVTKLIVKCARPTRNPILSPNIFCRGIEFYLDLMSGVEPRNIGKNYKISHMTQDSEKVNHAVCSSSFT